MSDYQVDSGWWIASNGKWYPPEIHPSARPESARGSGVVGEGDGGSEGDEETRKPIDPAHWLSLQMMAENAGLSAPPAGLATERWDWRDSLGKAAVKGIRTEVTGFTFFSWSALFCLLGLGYLALVLRDHTNMSLMLASPIVAVAAYPFALVRVRQSRRSRAAVGSTLPHLSRRQLAWLAAGVWIAWIGGICAFSAFAIFWGFEGAHLVG